MHRFVDETSISVKAGNGGSGSVSFRHEKYIEFGGPDGGDGGKGGNVLIQPNHRILNLSHIKYYTLYEAENGHSGSGKNKTGKDGKNITINVPLGTQIFDKSGFFLYDCLEEKPITLLHGGRGGKGNAFFKSSTHQTPRFAQPGEKTEKHTYKLALKLIADIGLIGFPNSGKSTLLKTLTKANPKIANYPFTTLTPNLGVIVNDKFEQILIADIPGIIEGASKGSGLGLSFLKHIERVRILIYVLDISTAHGEDDLKILRDELSSYNSHLLKRKSLIVFNKIDLIDLDFLKEYLASFQKESWEFIPISCKTGKGIDELRKKIMELNKKDHSRFL